jgi:GAF domain-containing protein
VGAEIARIEGRDFDAMGFYEEAIRSVRANGSVHNEALGNELAERFYAARGFEDISHLYLKKARYCYLRWGAEGKLRQLEEMHPHLRQQESAPVPSARSAHRSNTLISLPLSKSRKQSRARSFWRS